MTEETTINFTREAFMHPLNLGLLLGATLVSFFLNDAGMVPNVILTLAFGAELMYLGLIPQTPRFRRMIKTRKIRERDTNFENKQTFNNLTPDYQKRFLVLKHLSLKIRDNFENMPYTSQGMLQNIEQKIDGLLNNYVSLLDVNQRFHNFINQSSEDKISREIEEENKAMETIDSDALKERKQRRISILAKRLDRFKGARERFQITETEMETIEDAVRYIYEQSLTMKNPEEIGLQLDNLLMDVEETSGMISDIDEPRLDDFGLFDKKEDILDENDANDEPLTKTGNRVRN